MSVFLSASGLPRHQRLINTTTPTNKAYETRVVFTCTAAHSPCPKEIHTEIHTYPRIEQLCDSSDRILPTYSHPIQLLDQTDSSLSTAGSVLPQSLNNQLHGRFWHKVTFNTKVMLPFVGDDCAPQIPYSSTNI